MTSSVGKRRWRTRLVVGILLIAVCLFYGQFWLARPVGVGPAGPPVPPVAFQHTWTERPVVLLGVGDSITAGLGASRSELSYFSRLVKCPTDDFSDMRDRCLSTTLPNLEAVNVAVSGTNSIQHLDRIKRLASHDAAVLGIVVMTTGGNDLIHWYVGL